MRAGRQDAGRGDEPRAVRRAAPRVLVAAMLPALSGLARSVVLAGASLTALAALGLSAGQAAQSTVTPAGWRAGKRRIAFQACDDSDPATGLWSTAICQANARAYASDPSVLGVVGTYNSGCAKALIPILDLAPAGGLAMVSPGNTLVCLTEPSAECSGGEPASLYPRRRNYARVVPNDAYQGAGLAMFAEQKGLRRVYVLYAGEDPTSLGQAKTFRGAARKLGIKIVGFSAWDAKASSYLELMRQVAQTSPSGVL